MNKKAIALGACVIVASATAMPVALNATELNLPEKAYVRDAETGEPLDINITLKGEGTDEVISGLDVTIECEGQEPVTVKSNDSGVLEVNLPKYGTYKITSKAPEGYTVGLDTIIVYSAENTPESEMTLTLKKEASEVRPVTLKHVDAATKELIKGGKGQILDAETQEVVEEVNFVEGELVVETLNVDKSYVFNWTENIEGYEGIKETGNFTVVKGEGNQVVTLESQVSTEKSEEVNVMFELQDFTSKESLKSGKVVVHSVKGEESFELDFTNPETLTQTLVSGEEYDFEILEVPEGYIVPEDQESRFTVSNQDGKGGMVQVMYVTKESDLGSADSAGLPQTGGVATAGVGVAGLSMIAAALVKKFKR